jgi:CPA2 family monovalent cation:H+ antiporter-2
MHDMSILQDLLLLLLLALVNAYFFTRIKLSPIVGYLLTGCLVGPYGLHLISSIDAVDTMAEIGVILLLFTIGLEFSFRRILLLKDLMFKSGTTQLLLSVVFVSGAALYFGLTPSAAIVIGCALGLSSTAIVLRILQERGEVDSGHGRTVLAILLFQDLCVIFFIVLLPLVASGSDLSFNGYAVLKPVLILAGLFVVARYLLRPLLRKLMLARSAELFRLTVLVLVFGTAWLTDMAGLSLSLGAFLAGLALAESDYSHQALSDIIPFRDAFMAIFFIAMGMFVNLQMLVDGWPVLLGLTLLYMLIKFLAGSLAALWTKFPLRTNLLCGFLLFQGGEFSFVLLRQASTLEIFPDEVYLQLLTIVALTMMATPVVMLKAKNIANTIADRFSSGDVGNDADELERSDLNNHVVIAGYGVSGRSISRVLREEGRSYVHIEMNSEAVLRARAIGESIIFGDGGSPAVLQAARIEQAQALVVSINDPSSLIRIVKAARALSSDLYILVRARFILEIDDVIAAGADEVIPDEIEASLQLSTTLLRRFQVPEGRILQVTAKLRQEHYGALLQPVAADADMSSYLTALKGGRIEFVKIHAESACLGKTLKELDFRGQTGATVIGLIREEQTNYGVTPDMLVEGGDTLILLGDQEAISRAQDLLQATEESLS